MGYTNTWNQPFLPWEESESDRSYKRIRRYTLIIFILCSLAIPFLPVPEIEKKELKDVSPRLAKLILKKKKQPPPPVAKAKPKEKPKSAAKKPAKKKKPLTKKQVSARKKAKTSGLVAMSDELSDIRSSFNMSALDINPVQTRTQKTRSTSKTTEVLSARAKRSSGGINTNKLSRSTGGSKLAGRSTSKVSSNIGSGRRSSSGRPTGRGSPRGEGEIEQVFQKNKGAIFSLYNRALRKDPGLQGKLVLELTIASNGKVVKCRIISGSLGSKSLERKLIARIKLFRFAAKNVSQVKVTYPIEFLPS